MIQTAVIFSIILSFLSHEFLGLYTGGLISGGYLALYLHQPLRVAATYGAALVVFGIVKLLSRYLIIFGNRRYMAAILTGLVVHYAFTLAVPVLLPLGQDMRIIGYIIPGLIANDMLRQGVVKTTLAALLATGLVRAALMLGGLA